MPITLSDVPMPSAWIAPPTAWGAALLPRKEPPRIDTVEPSSTNNAPPLVPDALSRTRVSMRLSVAAIVYIGVLALPTWSWTTQLERVASAPSTTSANPDPWVNSTSSKVIEAAPETRAAWLPVGSRVTDWTIVPGGSAALAENDVAALKATVSRPKADTSSICLPENWIVSG